MACEPGVAFTSSAAQPMNVGKDNKESTESQAGSEDKTPKTIQWSNMGSQDIIEMQQ